MADQGTGPSGDQTVETPEGKPVLSSDEKLWVLFAHLGPIVVGFIAPLVIWLVKKDESEFIADQAKEALNFQITVFIAAMVSAVLLYVCIGAVLLPLVLIADLVFCIIAALKANEGERYRYPLTLRLIS